MTPVTTMTYVGQHVISELVMDQGEGIRDQLKFAAKHLPLTAEPDSTLDHAISDLPSPAESK